MRHSWHTIQGRPDFCLRSAFFQALVTGSIPVVNGDYYLDCVPYDDMIDYTQVRGSLEGLQEAGADAEQGHGGQGGRMHAWLLCLAAAAQPGHVPLPCSWPRYSRMITWSRHPSTPGPTS